MRISPAQLLRDSGHAPRYVRSEVVEAVRVLAVSGRIQHLGDEASLAIASLGSTTAILDALFDVGALPAGLKPEDQERLVRRTGLAAEAWESSTARRAVYPELASFLGLPAERAETIPEPPRLASADYPLFSHQRRAHRQVMEALASSGIALLHMPTGSGKTRTAMNVVCEVLRQNEGKQVLWLATMKELLQQASAEFETAWRHLGNRTSVELVHAYDSQEWSIRDDGDGVLFATPQTLRAAHARSMEQTQTSVYATLAERVSLIVFDEAHQSTAMTYREVMEGVSHASFPYVPILGLSATPGRTYLQSEDDYALIDLFDSVKITLDTSDSGYDNPVDYLVGNGYLARPEFRLLGRIETATGSERTPTMSSAEYLTFVVGAVLDLVQEGHTRIMVFARTIEEADLVASVLRVVGLAAASVNGYTPAAERDSATREYRAPSSAPRVLVNFGVFTAGFDAPQTSAVVIARPVRSLVAYSQMVGRGIRGPAAGGNTHAVIATVVDPSEPAFGNIASAFVNWNKMWE